MLSALAVVLLGVTGMSEFCLLFLWLLENSDIIYKMMDKWIENKTHVFIQEKSRHHFIIWDSPAKARVISLV